jgi:hypothetical protein
MPIPVTMTATELQDAAEDIEMLAELINDISKLLDQIARAYDHHIIEAVNAAWAPAVSIRSNSNTKLVRLAASLSPPED